MASRFVIFLTSDEPWGDVWHTPLVFAHELSKKHDVIFCNPPQKWKSFNLFRQPVKDYFVNPNLRIFQYHNIIPVTFFNRITTGFNDRLNELRIKKILAADYPGRQLIFWRFDTYRVYTFQQVGVFRKIYHVIDFYLEKEYDPLFAKEADLVISTSPKYEEHYLRFNKNVLVVPHGVSLDEQIAGQEDVSKIRQQFGKFIFCLGTVSDDIDFELLKKISMTYSQINLVLVGPIKMTNDKNQELFDELCKMENVKYIGPKHALEVKNYSAAALAGIVPYHDMDLLKKNRSPLRTLAYLSQNLPVITSIDSEIPELENKAIFTAAEHADFLLKINSVINGELKTDTGAVSAYLSQISYQSMIEGVFERLNV